MPSPEVDIAPRAPWIWHGADVWRVSEALAAHWAKNPQHAARWLGAYLAPHGVPAAMAWANVMRAVMGTSADRTAPTAEEIQEVVRHMQVRGR